MADPRPATSGPLLFVAAVSTGIFLPDALAAGGRDLFRVVIEFLRTVRRYGLLANFDNGTQFGDAFVETMRREWSRARLDELAAAAEALPDGARRADRFRRTPAELGSLYLQELEAVANRGRLIRLPMRPNGLPIATLPVEKFPFVASEYLDSLALPPDLIVVPPGPAPQGSISLAELAQTDLLHRLSGGDRVTTKTTHDYYLTLGTMIRTAHQRVMVIDPYLTTLSGTTNRYEAFVRLLLSLVADRASSLPPLAIELHTTELGNTPDSGRRMRILMEQEERPDSRGVLLEQTHREVSRTLRRLYREVLAVRPELAPRLKRIVVYYWKEFVVGKRSGKGRIVDIVQTGERFHDRYILTDHAGVELPYGVDCNDAPEAPTGPIPNRRPNTTILKLISRPAREFIEGRFRFEPRRGKPGAYDCLKGPLEVKLGNEGG